MGSKPIGFSGNDAMYTLEGNAEIYLIDEEGRKTGYYNGNEFNDIPGVNTEVLIGDNNKDKDRQSIYMSERKDLKAIIIGKGTGNYNLLVAGGNYYLKIENIKTSKGQIDEFISKEDSIEINFDDNKIGSYNILMDNFDYKNGSIYYSGIQSTGDIQKYIINWDGVSNGIENSVRYTINGNIVENKSSNNSSINEDIYIILLGIATLILFIVSFTFYLKKNKK